MKEDERLRCVTNHVKPWSKLSRPLLQKGERILCATSFALIEAVALVNGLRPAPHHPPHYCTTLSLQQYSALRRQSPEEAEPRRRKRAYM